MPKWPQPLVLRIFLSSPGDVSHERVLTRELLNNDLPYRPMLSGRVKFDLVSWDNPAAPLPMPAMITPQEAVNRFGPKPSECDIVVVVLWSRLGTHLDVSAFSKASGEPYLSGTEWEFEDAFNSQSSPEIFVYQRIETPHAPLDASDLDERRRQYDAVKEFLGRFRNKDGSARGGVVQYKTATSFKERLASDLEYLVRERLEKLGKRNTGRRPKRQPPWEGLPYPGLRSFRSDEAAIFFGRGREIDALISRLRDTSQRIIAVVGTSGCGKSSLIRAGLLPCVAAGAIEAGQFWRVISFTPGAIGNDPFFPLATEMASLLPIGAQRSPVEIAEALRHAPEQLTGYAAALLADRPRGAQLTLFIDQFEELFTTAAGTYWGTFIKLLVNATTHPRIRVLLTVRADFLSRCVAEPELAPLLQAGTFVLGPPGPSALVDIVRKPAERAGLHLDDDFADEILGDAGDDPGALPLVAFCLEELYRQTSPERHFTLAAYHALGGLRGSVSRRTEAILRQFREDHPSADFDAFLPQIFGAVIQVDADGTATRRRMLQYELSNFSPLICELVEALIRGRLLLAETTGGLPTIALAHEALFEAWPALNEWLELNRVRLQRLHRLHLSLESSEKSDRVYAIHELSNIPSEAAKVAPAILRAARDPDREIRAAAIKALGNLGNVTAEIVPELLKALTDAKDEVRRLAREAIGEIGPPAAEAVPELIKHFSLSREWNVDVRISALGALARIGPGAAEAVPALVEALDGRGLRSEVGIAVVKTLGEIGPATPNVVPALIRATRRFTTMFPEDDDDIVERTLACMGMARPEVVLSLIDALFDPKPSIRACAAQTLGLIGPEALGMMGPAVAEVVPALTKALSDKESSVRAYAREALDKIAPTVPGH